jgi:hypothetical protein
MKEHPEGMLLYIFGSTAITTVHVYYRAEFVSGLKGPNGHFEAPEICIYLFTHLFPHMIMADQFLGLLASNMCWYFMMVLLLFGLTGRFGLEWLLAFKNGGTKVTTIENETTIKTSVTDEQK